MAQVGWLHKEDPESPSDEYASLLERAGGYESQSSPVSPSGPFPSSPLQRRFLSHEPQLDGLVGLPPCQGHRLRCQLVESKVTCADVCSHCYLSHDIRKKRRGLGP